LGQYGHAIPSAQLALTALLGREFFTVTYTGLQVVKLEVMERPSISVEKAEREFTVSGFGKWTSNDPQISGRLKVILQELFLQLTGLPRNTWQSAVLML
jgi:hypothetical protein